MSGALAGPRTLGGTYGVAWDTDSQEPVDEAPDGSAVWNYSLRLPFGLTVVPSTDSFDLTDAEPRSGRGYVLAIRVRRDDTGSTVREGRISCTARLGTAPLTGAKSRFFPILISAGSDQTQATCSWQLPRRARGLRLKAVGGKTVSRTTTAIVR